MSDQVISGRYELGDRLGLGGMSTVHLAFDRRLEREVAVKLLAEHLAEDATFVERFKREALAAARLVHPNIVQVFDFGLDEPSDRHFIVMEYIRGQSGAEILRDRGAIPLEEALAIVGHSCRGLDYAHRNDVVHRDVKPGNLLRAAATETVWFEIKEKTGATEFLGYDTETAEGVVAAIVASGKEAASLNAGSEGALILNQTPFYGESGGQVGDVGVIKTAAGAVFRVTETQKKLGDLFVHVGRVESGAIAVGDAVELTVDHAARSATRANHSATHLLHEALRQTLGLHVAQKGSLVSPERLRFDFSHTKPMSADEIKTVEDIANAVLLENTPVVTRLMALDDARAQGAMALFGEKYGDEVRVVSMGHGSDHGGSTQSSVTKAWSVELCGGTHVQRTGDIGLIKVVAESASAAGVRRLEALTGEGARAYLALQDSRVREAANILKTRPDDVVDRLKALVDERKALERQLADAKRQIALSGGGAKSADGERAGDAIKTIGAIKLLSRTVQGLNPKDLRGLIDDGKKQVGSGVVAVVGVTEDGKAGLAVGITDDLTKTWSAVDLVKAGAEALGGKGGGGRADMAQAGGPDGSKAPAALAAIEAALAG